jgi:hypothetical protein
MSENVIARVNPMGATQTEKAARFHALHGALAPSSFRTHDVPVPHPCSLALASRHWPHPALPPPLPLVEGMAG